ncbi:hypothetical protein CPC08DRAFT_815284 [Agrocybe pediades]|nr:hypothetical protein CPC08DRAFT_815284 [Agrocybe pediades]
MKIRREDAFYAGILLRQKIKDLINSTEELRLDADQVPGEDSFDLNVFVQKLAEYVGPIIADLEKELALPPPENQTDVFKQRNATITLILDKVEGATVQVYAQWNVSEAEARKRFEPVKVCIRDVVLAIGKLADEHPTVLMALLMPVPFIRELSILLPLLSVLGFGPGGPIKGSLAASMQRIFFGSTVAIPGSWFSILQSARMKSANASLGFVDIFKSAILKFGASGAKL